MPDEQKIVYDLRGLKCPLPVLKTRKRMSTLAPGALLEIETTDPLAVIDIPHFCNEDGHKLVEAAPADGGHRFLIRKGA
ncbi:sulfurtransferase TusA family protein [Ensifer sp. 2YAB10]|uniref:sulfurtransferase TusA family protein n=1 Tax=Ensifer TaxID=106591 RepID=UPI001CBF0237|nr:sulfurtransferase TusA family protein [Ensifer adhaerens]MBZ7923055.1 sulfurtransferase TusA family protein [Ensifer adhaerens]UAX91648.1 sulfurtransferase TusA family protein [Ensifer adhaerens]UAX99276.1 sulfurtransferase TusA family protein [Ensifer adhaerens]UAY06659.1 sulfurtransferase TusA family protein [Ensifer adhaerens]